MPYNRFQGVPPLVHVLFGPPGSRIIGTVVNLGIGNGHQCLIEKHRFHTGGAQIDTQYVFHESLKFND